MFIKALSQLNTTYITNKVINKHLGYGEVKINSSLYILEGAGYIKLTKANGYYTKVDILVDVPTPKFLYQSYTGYTKEVLCDLYINDFQFTDPKDISIKSLRNNIGGSSSTANRWRGALIDDGVYSSSDTYELSTDIIVDDYLKNTVLCDNGLLKYVALAMACECKLCGSKDSSKFSSNNRSKCTKCTSDIRVNKIKDLDNLEEMFKIKLASSKYKILKKGKEFAINVDYCIEQYKKQDGKCYYCNEPFDQDNKYESLSIERLDSNLGYIPGNVVFTFLIYNLMKLDMTDEQFRYYIEKIAKRK